MLAAGRRTAPGKRKPSSRPVCAAGALSSISSRVGPSYQSRRSPRSTTMSPLSAESGMKRTSSMPSLRGEFEVVGADAFEDGLVVADQIHLVDRHHQVRNVDQMGQVGVAPGLRQHALARVDQDDGEVGGRGGGDHVARVLLVPGRVGDDVLARAGGEVAVGDVDGDALLALGLQAVGEQRQIDRFQAALFRGSGDGVTGCRRGSSWCRRADARSACSCRRRRCRR